MESDPNQMSQSAPLCRSGCGFYGNPSNDGLCSKCYKDALKRKQAAPTTSSSTSSSSSLSNNNNNNNVDNTATIKTLLASSTTTSSPLAALSSSATSSNVSAISAQESSQSLNAEVKSSTTDEPKTSTTSETNTSLVAEEETPTKSQKKKKMRCPICRANLGIIRFDCRCGGFFCGTHRYSNMHNCSFDYKEHGAEEIRKNNPQVIGEKVQKI